GTGGRPQLGLGRPVPRDGHRCPRRVVGAGLVGGATRLLVDGAGAPCPGQFHGCTVPARGRRFPRSGYGLPWAAWSPDLAPTANGPAPSASFAPPAGGRSR